MNHSNIVQQIWGLCNILRDDGISYHQYVAELTYLLFLKFAQDHRGHRTLPKGCSWADLVDFPKTEVLAKYQDSLTQLGKTAPDRTIREIFAFPTTVFSHSENLSAVIQGLSDISWEDIKQDHLGDIYEGLIERSSQDVRSGAGQYFTPRPLIRCIVMATKPALGELIQDPALGSGGFITAADAYVRHRHSRKAISNRPPRYQGAEIEKNTRRICLMNCYLNGIHADVMLGDTLTEDAVFFEPADLILANPPFGIRVGGRRKLRRDLLRKGASKQLLFLQHIYLNLRRGGRAAVVVPDNVLFDTGAGQQIRKDLMDVCDLHTILRLPTGIFYSAGVKTNVLFLVKGRNEARSTDDVWIYDLRNRRPSLGRSRPLTEDAFTEFLACYGKEPCGTDEREDMGDQGRFRRFSRREIKERDYNLDISWLQANTATDKDELTPEDIASSIFTHLKCAMEEMEVLTEELESEGPPHTPK